MAEVRLARILRLLTLLRAKFARRPRELAAELEVCERTVYRDLGVLAAMGAPVRFDAEAGGYRVGGDFFLPPVQLTLGEALALSVLGSQVARQGQVPFLQEAWRAVTKVRSQLPAALAEEVAGADAHVRVQGARVSPQEGCGGHFETFRKAIAVRRKVRCRYGGGHASGHSGGQAEARREPFLFRPYALFFNQRAWYVIGHSELRGGERSLKLNRLLAAGPTDRPYMIPDGWTLEKCLGRAWRMMRGDRRFSVSIRFDAEAGRNVADTLWHPTQTLAWGADGSLTFECEVDGLEEIVWWVLGYGPHARVVGPPELRRRVGDLARRTCNHYDDGRVERASRREQTADAVRVAERRE